MATYTIKELNVSNFKDQNGNSYVNAAFEEFGEPVTLVVKDPTKLSVGQKLDGEIKVKERSNGNGSYNRFFRDKPQDFQGGNQGPKAPFTPRDDSAIQAQWAINQAREAVLLEVDDPSYYDAVEDIAKHFFAMISRVKNPTVEKDPLPDEDLNSLKVSLADIPF